jgi:PAS domain S-box-containing protein/putative nucleotidyltransferase with HDIG domain
VVGYLPHHQPLAVITADAVLLGANRPFLDLLGASGDEHLGSDWDDFMPGWTQRTGGRGEPRIAAFEDYLLPAGGEPVWVRVVACPVFTPGVGEETEEALAAWALFVLDRRPGRGNSDEHRRRAILDLLLESPSEFVVQLGADGTLEYISPSLRRALGVFGDGAEGGSLEAVHALIADEFRGRFTHLMESLLAPPFTAEFEMTMTTSGTAHVVHWRFESLLADGGDVRGILGIGHDVTGRRRAEGELAHSELQLRTLVEATNQLIWTTAPGGALDGAMESWCAFTGQTDGQARGEGWLDAVHPDDRERVREKWAATAAAGAVYDCEYRLRAAGGDYRWIEARAVPLPGDGRRPRYFGVGHDISERKAALEAASRRVQLESMGASVSTRLAGATLDTAPLAVDFALGESGRQLRADVVSLYVLAPDGGDVESARVWRREDNAVGDGDTSLGLARLAWLRERAPEAKQFLIRSVDDLPEDAVAERELFRTRGLEATLVVPLLMENALIGVLAYAVHAERDDDAAPDRGRDGEAGWSEEDVSLVRMVADQLSRLLVWRRDELNLRAIADCFLAFGTDVDDNHSQICRAAAVITSADVVLYTRRRGEEFVVQAGWNVPDHLPRVTPLWGRLDADLVESPDEQVRIVRDLQDTLYAHTSPVIAALGARTYAGFPVLVGGRAVGTLSCLFTGDVPLRESQLELMRVLGRAAAVEEERRHALEDRLLGLAQLEQAMERTVTTLSAAVGTRDPYTRGHERRVADLSMAVGAELGMDLQELRLLRLAATVHDIGKITLPAEILTKPTRLSEAEFELIKRHSEAGWEMLEPAGLPEAVTEAVVQHHERMDGSGYPAGLRGDEIGEFARIIAVADVVEAMSSDRPYRPAIGVEPALSEIEEGRGVRYDERVVDACLRLFREKGFVLRDEERPER